MGGLRSSASRLMAHPGRTCHKTHYGCYGSTNFTRTNSIPGLPPRGSTSCARSALRSSRERRSAKSDASVLVHVLRRYRLVFCMLSASLTSLTVRLSTGFYAATPTGRAGVSLTKMDHRTTRALDCYCGQTRALRPAPERLQVAPDQVHAGAVFEGEQPFGSPKPCYFGSTAFACHRHGRSP